MSCFIISEESCSTIADFLELQLNFGFNNTGLDTTRELEQAFSDCRINGEYKAKAIYTKLYRENIKAYRGRYNNTDPIMIPLYKESKLPPRLKFHDYVLLHKKIACLAYQLAERTTIDGDIYKVLEDLINNIAEEIVFSLPESEAISWG